MKISIAILGILLGLTITARLASATTYVSVAGQAISEENLGANCPVAEKLADGRLMIYTASVSDGQLLKARMIESGVTDEATLDKWQQMAQANACQRGAGLDCSGNCPSGSCQKETKGGWTGCVCK